jgi:hypothetical protein
VKTGDQLQDNVQRTFAAALKCADSSMKCRLIEAEAALWTMTLEFGRALIALFLFRQAARVRPATYEHARQRFVIAETWRRTSIGTRFGKVSFARPVGRRVGKSTAQADLPVDRELGLCGGFSLGVAAPHREALRDDGVLSGSRHLRDVSRMGTKQPSNASDG